MAMVESHRRIDINTYPITKNGMFIYLQPCLSRNFLKAKILSKILFSVLDIVPGTQ